LSWSDRARVSINFGSQPSAISFDTSATKPTYQENAVFQTAYTVSGGPIFDGGAVVRIVKSLGVGVVLSRFSRRDDAGVSGTVPHPFFYNRPRSISGTAPGLERGELGAHVQAVYVVSRRKFDLVLGAGPSWFSVKQDLVTDAAYSQEYPYDVATFASASTSRVTKLRFGFNVGVDVGLRMTRTVGVGGVVRFSRASVDLASVNGTAATVGAGGLQVGGGLRLFL
jgi:hypothetical protein